jgi:hypothetical protein
MPVVGIASTGVKLGAKAIDKGIDIAKGFDKARVGRRIISGNPVSRERQAINDIIQGNPNAFVYFVGYNSGF